MLPTELATASPAAAAAPPRMAGGRTQNCEIVVITPIVPTVSAIMAIGVECAKETLKYSPTAPTMPGNARCQRRSPRASELWLTSTMVMAAAAYGIALSNPMFNGSDTPLALIKVGSQKLTP